MKSRYRRAQLEVKALSARQIEKILRKNGFEISRQKGSHRIYKHIKSGRIVPVPIHKANSPLKIGTFLSIVKQSGLNKSAFEK